MDQLPNPAVIAYRQERLGVELQGLVPREDDVRAQREIDGSLVDVTEDIADAADADSPRPGSQVHVLQPLRVVHSIAVRERDVVVHRAALIPLRGERHVGARVPGGVGEILRLQVEVEILPRVRRAADPASVRERLANERASIAR